MILVCPSVCGCRDLLYCRLVPDLFHKVLQKCDRNLGTSIRFGTHEDEQFHGKDRFSSVWKHPLSSCNKWSAPSLKISWLQWKLIPYPCVRNNPKIKSILTSSQGAVGTNDGGIETCILNLSLRFLTSLTSFNHYIHTIVVEKRNCTYCILIFCLDNEGTYCIVISISY